MNTLEKRMVGILADLKRKHHVIGVKAEFEAEGTRIEEAQRLKEVVSEAGLPLTIKIGGCEALKDMYDARGIGAKSIVAPMIESPFALRKFIQAAKAAFSPDERADVKFLINIETIAAFKNLEGILSTDLIKELDGIVIGRGDLSESLGKTRDYINSPEVEQLTRQILAAAKQRNLICGIGGGVSEDSLSFFKKLPAGHLDYFETRKVLFRCPKAITAPSAREGILKAVGFEIMWLKNKQTYYRNISREDQGRLEALESRYRKS